MTRSQSVFTSITEVNAVYLMSGAFDFMVMIEGKTHERGSSSSFPASCLPLDSVLSTSTHFVLKKYKDHGTVLAEEAKMKG